LKDFMKKTDALAPVVAIAPLAACSAPSSGCQAPGAPRA
jgi:hypothetical protein